MAGLNVAGIIQLLIFLIVGGAIWYLFKLFAPKVGLPDIVVQVVTVLIVVILAVLTLRFLGTLL
jgi:uncharacterized membrane protein YjjP (DUF1212 family)